MESLPDASDPTPVRSMKACPGPKQAWAVRAVRRTICRMTFTRITVDPDLMAGVPTIRGLRIPVATVVSMVADGMTAEEICRDLPDLAPEDVAEALRYAAESVRERQLPLRPSA
jgi:uncharacterized protein (DUF433 family)